MYNRLFTKILDSSIWLEADTTRLIWITFLASMDEDGFAAFSSTENLSRRANIPIEATVTAVTVLENPDKYNPDDEFEGRRIERVTGGWIVLKAEYYRGILTREIAREQTRIRVAKHREKKKDVTNPTLQNVTAVTCNTSEHSIAEHIRVPPISPKEAGSPNLVPTPEDIYNAYPRHEAKVNALAAIKKAIHNGYGAPFLLERTVAFAKTQPPHSRYTPLPASWFNAERFNDDPAEWIREETRAAKPDPKQERLRRELDKAKEQYG